MSACRMYAVDGNRSVVEVQPERVNVGLFSCLTACRRSLENLARMLRSLRLDERDVYSPCEG